jgi:hypothetical protein
VFEREKAGARIREGYEGKDLEVNPYRVFNVLFLVKDACMNGPNSQS